MIKNKAYKFRLCPNAEQREYFAKCFGCVRFIYNQMLAERIGIYNQYKDNKVELKAHKPKTYSIWKSEYNWLYEIDNLALANAQLQLQAAYLNFFRDPKNGFPKFRSKKSGKNTYTTNNQKDNIRIENKSIRLPRVGMVRIKQHRTIPETHKIKSCTISLAPTGKYFISILTEYEFEPPIVTLSKDRALGLDYSSPHFYVDSQGVQADMPHFFREAESRLAKERRKLDKMIRGSNNYEKQRINVARAYEHVANQRKDWLHKKSTELANEWDYICVEDINLRGMAGSLKLGKSTNDNGFGMFREMLKYKLYDRGKVFIKIDKWFPSSKMCSVCGAINKELGLKDREWTCECGTHHDRDLNAARNIRNFGLALID
jgi:putative transposase